MVVGVGASAGGLEAIQEFLRGVSPRAELAIIVVQHLPTGPGSNLTEVISRNTRLPVSAIEGNETVTANHVYVLPANRTVEIQGNRLRLHPRLPSQSLYLPVNELLISLALDQGRRSAAVVLSGTASDGAEGVVAVRKAGGATFAQSEDTAEYQGMPSAARATGAVHFVLAPIDIGRKLSEIATSARRHHRFAVDVPSRAAKETEGQYNRILELILKFTGVDFRYYKPSSVERRIRRRMDQLQITSLARYELLLERDSGEIQRLTEGMLIPVTGFFRDPGTFKVLKEEVFPSLLGRRPLDRPIRIWIAGCSTGEEAYSIAMAFMEAVDRQPNPRALQIFATDISETAIAQARAGIFSERAVKTLSADRFRRFFVRSDDDPSYRICKPIREMCVFSVQDITRDPPFSHMDMVSCRNLLIYFGPTLQDQVMPRLHYALNPNGFLLLGTAEGLPRHSELFEPVNSHRGLFRRRAEPPRVYLSSAWGPSRVEFNPSISARVARTTTDTPASEIGRVVDRALLRRSQPAVAVVTRKLDILELRGSTDPFLEVPSGRPNYNLMHMARRGLSTDVARAVERAARHHAPVTVHRLPLRSDGQIRSVSVEVTPLGSTVGGQMTFLVIFEFDGQREGGPRKPLTAALDGTGKPASETSELRQAKRERDAERANLQVIIEEQSTMSEELRAANEEIQASNEELQSSNEELQTAREELQSTNEELTTLNEELARSNKELRRNSDDLENVLQTAQIPVLLLDEEFRIRQVTPPVRDLLRIIPGDLGRSILDLSLTLGGSDLVNAVTACVRHHETRELEIQHENGRWFSVRLLPFRKGDGQYGGAVVSFLDIDAQRRRLEEVKTALDAHLRKQGGREATPASDGSRPTPEGSRSTPAGSPPRRRGRSGGLRRGP